MWRIVLVVSGMVLSAGAAQATVVDFDDARRGEQWYLDAMNFPQAWGRIVDLPQRAVIRSAVLDSGFDRAHVELGENTYRGYNVITGQKDVFPANAHGTATLGLMAASSGNGTGITRAAFTSPVLPVQITNQSTGGAYMMHMIEAIHYAVDRGARVISLSYTGVQLSMIADAAHYAARHGAVLFMAAGNDGEHYAHWQNHNWVVAVGSVDPDGQVSGFSNRGGFVDFVAPGRSILTTVPDDGYGRWSGTSFSTPLAASVASLMLTANPQLSAGQVIRILRATAIDLGEPGVDDDSGYGLIDAAAAVELALATEGKWTEDRQALQTRWSGLDLATLGGLQLSSSLLTPVAPIATDIPEPGASLLLSATLAGVLSRRRRRG